MRVVLTLCVLFFLAGVEGSRRPSSLRRLTPEQQRTSRIKARRDDGFDVSNVPCSISCKPKLDIRNPSFMPSQGAIDTVRAPEQSELWLQEVSDTESETESDTESETDFHLDRDSQDKEWDTGYSEKHLHNGDFEFGPRIAGEATAVSAGAAKDPQTAQVDTSQPLVPVSVLGKRAHINGMESPPEKRRYIDGDNISQQQAIDSFIVGESLDHQPNLLANGSVPAPASSLLLETPWIAERIPQGFHEDASIRKAQEEVIESLRRHPNLPLTDITTIVASIHQDEAVKVNEGLRKFKTMVTWPFLVSRVLYQLRTQALLVAMKTKKYDVLKVLFEHGAKGTGQIPLKNSRCPIIHFAVRTEDVELVRAVLEAGGDANAKYQKKTPLQVAAVKRNQAMKRLLEQYGAKETKLATDVLNRQHESVLCGEDTRDHFQKIENLIETNNANELDSLLASGKIYLSSKLLQALRDQALRVSQNTGHYQILKVLLRHGANGSGALANGMPIVHYALRTGDVDLVRAVFEAGAPHDALYCGQSLLQHSMANTVPGMRDVLKAFGAKEIYLATDLDSHVQYIERGTFGKAELWDLQDAIENDNVEEVRRLLQAIGPSLQRIAMMRLRDQALRRAKESRTYDVVKVLLEHGASGAGAMPDGGRCYIVYYAARTGDLDFLQAVLNAGGNANVRCRQKSLLKNVEDADPKIIELLKQYGAED